MSGGSDVWRGYLYDVGSTVGNTRTDSLTGAYTYSVPISTPPGRAGIEPSLSFSYSNQGGKEQNAFGYGWDVAIPYIERTNKAGTEDLYSAQYFSSSLSGELATTTDASVFYPRVDDGSFLSYAYASSTNKWTVMDKEGTTYKFGHTAAARMDDPGNSARAYRWMLEEVRDTNGNYATYEYYKDGGFIYPSKITYTGNNTTPGIFTVDFLRETRPDIATSSASAFVSRTQYRIDEVQVSMNGSWVRKYALTYGSGENDRRSMLTSITESASNADIGGTASSSLPATTFSYRQTATGWASTTDFALPYPFRDDNLDLPDTGLRVADYNGDALPDLIRSMEGTTTQMYANDGDGWNLDGAWSFPTPFIDDEGEDQGVRLADVNGDGLVDVVRSTPVVNQVYLNTGTGFATSSTWAAPINFVDSSGGDMGVRFGDFNGDGLIDLIYSDRTPQYPGLENSAVYLNTGDGWSNIGWTVPVEFVNLWLIDIDGDGIADLSRDTLNVDITDLNGDGLADLVTEDADVATNDLGAYMNNGAGWSYDPSWTIPSQLAETIAGANNGLADVNADGLPDYIDMTYQTVYINDGRGWVLDASWTLPSSINGENTLATHVLDVDGDGMPDFLQRDETIHARYLSKGESADQLVHIDESRGSEVDVAYEPSADAVAHPDLPFVITTVSGIGMHDGFAPVGTTTYAYEAGKYYFANAFDRLYAGFKTVSAIDPEGNVSTSYFHQGDATATSTGEYDDRRSKIGRAYRTERYDDDDHLYQLDVTQWNRSARNSQADFIGIGTTTSLTYDADSDHKDTAETFAYSTTTGSVLQRTQWGEVTATGSGTFTDTGSDKFTTAYTYAASSTSSMLKPSSETKTNQSGTKIAEKRYYYDALSLGSVTKGNLTKEESWKDGTNYVDVEKTYNAYGLVTQDKDPRDKATTYAYDSYNLYPATVTNALSQAVAYTYDYSSGKVRRTTDANGRVYLIVVDPFDRPTDEKQPDLTTPSTSVSHRTYAYEDFAMPRYKRTNELLASTTNNSKFEFFNGLGQKVEERVEAEGTATYAVRDFYYDSRGNLYQESLPRFASSTTYGGISSPPASDLRITYEYDLLGRVTSVANAVGETTTSYDQWSTTVTDPLDNDKDYLKDAYGNLAKVSEHNGASTYHTNYEYDGNGKLTKITDADGNIRNFTYDGLGRRITAQDLHDASDGTFGTWTYGYDASGNLTSQVDPKSQTVNFTYDDINRPLTEDYTGTGGTEVLYAYDTCTEGIGRLCTATSTGAVTKLTYNPVGMVASEARTIGGTTYSTSYALDQKGNPTLITYPDGSQASYAYNAAGMLESVSHKPSGGSFSAVVSQIDYAPTGKVAYKKYGNGVETRYTFDANQLYRLTNIRTTASTSDPSYYEWLEGVLMETVVDEGPSDETDLDLADDVGSELPIGAPEGGANSEEPELAEGETDEDAVPPGDETPAGAPEDGEDDEIPTDPLPGEGDTASSTPDGTPPEWETPDDVLPAGPIDPIATSTPPTEATSTPPVIEEPVAEPEEALLPYAPGARFEGANMVTEAIGTSEDGKTIYRTDIASADTAYLDAEGVVKPIDIRLADAGDAWTMTDAPYSARIAKAIDDRAIAFRTGKLELYFSPLLATPAPSDSVEAAAESRAADVRADKETENQKDVVSYPDALAPGVDLEVRLAPDALWKEAVIASSEAAAGLATDGKVVEVPFSFGANEAVTLTDGEGQSLSGDGELVTSSWVKIEGASGSAAYLRPPVATDAKGRSIPITIRIEQSGGVMRLTKLIPADWLLEAAHPVRTDAVVTYYLQNYGFGGVEFVSAGWDATHDASSGTAHQYEYEIVNSARLDTNVYQFTRISLPFDTSGLPDNAAISSATLDLFVNGRINTEDDGNDFLRVVQTTIASTTSLADGDFDQIGAVNNPTAGASDVDLSNIYANDYIHIDLNATGRGWINKTGYTKLGLREGHDVVDDPLTTTDAYNSLEIKMPAYGGTYHSPTLSVTYTLPTPPTAPAALQTEGQTNPTAIDDYAPEFSAVFQDPDATDVAAYYQIQVATSSAYWGSPTWNSGKTALSELLPNGTRSPEIAYGGAALTASSTYYWRIRFWDEGDNTGAFSTTTSSFMIAPSGSHTSPTYQSTANASWIASTSVSIPRPSGLSVGDLMVAVLAIDGGTAAAPSGWKQIALGGELSDRVGLAAFAKVAAGSDTTASSTSYLFSGSTYVMNGSIIRLTNASLHDIAASLVQTNSWSPNAMAFSPGVTPIEPDSFLIAAYHSSHTLTNYSTYQVANANPTWTERTDANSSVETYHSWAVATAPRNNATTTGSFGATRGSTGGKAYALLLAIAGNAAPSAPTSPKTEGKTDPMVVTDDTPEFSAVYEDIDDGDLATRVRIQVSTSTSFASPFWDSGNLSMATTSEGSRSPEISYAGPALTRETTYYWRMRFLDDDGQAGAFSSTASFRFTISGPTGLIQNISYQYDDAGNITKITDVSGTQAAKVTNFTYDDLYRLTIASTTAASTTPYKQVYAYTPIGNLSSSTMTGAYAYAETGYTNPHAPTTVGSTTLTYDQNGNLTAYGAKHYAFDYRNRMTGSNMGGATTTYAYDHQNQRTQKTLSGTTTAYVNKLYATDGVTKTAYVYAGDELLASVETVGSTTPSVRYVHADHLGSTNALTDSAGVAVQSLDYYPFGLERVNDGAADEPRAFLGERQDDESNLNYLNARYYDSARGQFVSQDPVFWEVGETGDGKTALTNPQAQNSYSYVGNNPVTGKDPSGRFAAVVAVPIITAPEWVPWVAAGGAALISSLYIADQFDPSELEVGILQDSRPYDNMIHPPPEDPNDLKPPKDGASSWSKWLYRILAGGYLGYTAYDQYEEHKQGVPKMPKNGNSSKQGENKSTRSSNSSRANAHHDKSLSALKSAYRYTSAATHAFNQGDFSGAAHKLQQASQALRGDQ